MVELFPDRKKMYLSNVQNVKEIRTRIASEISRVSKSLYDAESPCLWEKCKTLNNNFFSLKSSTFRFYMTLN